MNQNFFQPLGVYLRQWSRAHPEFDPAHGAQLQDAFRQAVDAKTAAHAAPLRVRNGELLIAASPVWATKLRHQHATLLQQLKRPGSAWERQFAQVRSLRIVAQPEHTTRKQ